MSARSEFRDAAREDERRKRDEAKIQGLQTQLDELRALSRELVSRQARLEDQLKTSEANVAQQRLLLEQHRHEVTQSAQARQLEEGRYRQQLVDLAARIDDSTRPIRSLQAHVAELLEAVRRQKDDVGQDGKRFDELRVLIDHLAAHGERQIAVSQALRDSIETVRVEVEQVQRDLLRTDDSVKIVDQESRRRVAEVGQQIENVSARLESAFSMPMPRPERRRPMISGRPKRCAKARPARSSPPRARQSRPESEHSTPRTAAIAEASRLTRKSYGRNCGSPRSRARFRSSSA